MAKKAFTLVELMIVVAVLGILAAIVLPSLQAHTTEAKEAAAKDMLRTMRNQINLYKHHHNDQLPGYVNGAATTEAILQLQFTNCTSVTGQASPSKIPAGAFEYGPYFLKLPANPFNELTTIKYIANAETFAAKADGTSSGWLYKKETGEIAVNSALTDKDSVKHYDY